MPDKRKRVATDNAARPTALKRRRHTETLDLLSPLSDELLVRILTYLPISDLLNLAPVSNRFYELSGDSQIWKRLYYSRFVLPRALRIPGFRDGTARAGKLHYSSRRTIWADGRRGGWVDLHADKETRNWKRQYKLRHNWARGKCAVEELQVGEEPPETRDSPKMLVKVLDGVAITADFATGLRVWDLKTKQLLTHMRLDDADSDAIPSCMDIDDQHASQRTLDIAIGFTDGSFGVWRLFTDQRHMVRRYRHEISSNGGLVGAAYSYPYLLTATKSVLISLYTFQTPPNSETETDVDSETEKGSESETAVESDSDWGPTRSKLKNRALEEMSDELKTTPEMKLSAPYLLTSLKSHSSRSPLALSLRRTGENTVASIAYTFSTLRGWSLGIQELHIKPPTERHKAAPDVTTTQLAYTSPFYQTQGRDRDDWPISLSYTHPYLLATLPDNTLILYLCRSSASALTISPGIRLWGHTSGISDAEVTARGKAVSVSSRGEEIRVWELEGRTNGRSVEVRPTMKNVEVENPDGRTDLMRGDQWDEKRNWVGFDDEMVIVLKESLEGRESLLVYDFT
ncbi:hypothetical protein F5Y18DRAFT_324005 [Xylariaceae sp. FL1019]|nr:hypothetical protein F5Y18DRAFT_324005 [Xylariaceae sp. FL1019]